MTWRPPTYTKEQQAQSDGEEHATCTVCAAMTDLQQPDRQDSSLHIGMAPSKLTDQCDGVDGKHVHQVEHGRKVAPHVRRIQVHLCGGGER